MNVVLQTDINYQGIIYQKKKKNKKQMTSNQSNIISTFKIRTILITAVTARLRATEINMATKNAQAIN